MWYLTIETLGTALKIFTPAAILSWLYRHDSFISKIIQQCDKTIKSVLYRENSDEPDEVLKWLQEILPQDRRIASLDTIWANGSVVCDIVQSMVPGSCPGHHDNVDFSHGQRLAEQYLGITPVFSSEDLSQTALTTYNECKLSHFLNSIKEALGQLSPPISRAGSPILNVQAYTLDYVARGMGLVTATQNKKATFYVYPTAQQAIEPGDISIQIKGPNGCYGSTLVPAIYGKTHIIRSVFMNLGSEQCGIIKNNIDRNYFLAKIANDIDVNVIVFSDKVKISYVPTICGCHELSLISKGCHVIGSPFRISVEEYSGTFEINSFYDDDLIDKELQKSDKKVVFRIVDFVTEKMLLKEDGSLEQISSEDAAALIHKVESMENMSLEYPDLNIYSEPDLIDKTCVKIRFVSFARKVLLILRICRELKEMASKRKKNVDSKENISTPDIINSTLKERCPEELVCELKSAKELRKQYKNKLSSFNQTTDKEVLFHTLDNIVESEVACPISTSVDIIVSSFDDDEEEDIEYITPIERPKTPFDRPKTPVIKILLGDEEDTTEKFHGFDINKYEGRFDSLTMEYNDEHPNIHLFQDLKSEDMSTHINSTSSINFHIGEPVSFVRTVGLSNAEEDMDSIISAPNLEEALHKFDIKMQNNNESHLENSLVIATPFEQMTDSEILKMYEEPSDDFTTKISNAVKITRSSSADTWDSAYVSIDDVNSSPEENKSPQKFFNDVDFSKMGPAERELWESMTENDIIKESDYNSINLIHTNNAKKHAFKYRITSISPIIENDICDESNDDVFVDNKNGTPHDGESDGSASDRSADVNLSHENAEPKLISSIQTQSELKDVNQIDLNIKDKTNVKKTFRLSKSISEKKVYWDEKINNVLSSGDFMNNKTKAKSIDINKNDIKQCAEVKVYNLSETCDEVDLNDKLVTKWKKYWDEKIEKSPSPDSNTKYIHNHLLKNRKYLVSPDEDSAEENEMNHKSDRVKYSHVEELENNILINNSNSKVNTDKLDYKEHSRIIKNLSERIDRYLDTITTPSPYITDLDETRFSTPDTMILKEEENPINQKSDDSLSVKKLKEIFNKKSEARDSFIKNKSKTVDFPMTSSIKKLKKYFSIDSIPTMKDININCFYKTENNNKNEDKIINNEIGIQKCTSTDSIPTLSEKKAIIELHLKNMQDKIKKNSNSKSTPNIHSSITTYDDKIVPINKTKEDRVEIKQVSVPISSIVAQFEKCLKQSKDTVLQNSTVEKMNNSRSLEQPKLSDAVSLVGTTLLKKEPATLPISNLIEETSIPNKDEFIQSDKYKERFQKAKLFFQNLDGSQKNVPENPKPLNECEKILLGIASEQKQRNKPYKSCNDINVYQNIESINNKRNKVFRKTRQKAFSAPTSDTEYEYQKYMKGAQLMKISEKFLVKDLFRDVAGESNKMGFGSFRGIPHKSAVLAAFKSMENVDQITSYEYSNSQMIGESQVYEQLKDIDEAKSEFTSSGLILRKDFLKLQRSRRNSAPGGSFIHSAVYINS